MPSRNIVKEYAADSYYHIYNRGVNKAPIYLDEQDYTVFLSLLKRYLDSKPTKDQYQREYQSFKKEIELLAFCLMPNHFHLLIFQNEEQLAIEKFMRCVITTYSMYFNKKYKRIGPVFQGPYKAVRIADQSYLEHISRYIHLNPIAWQTYEWSSLPYFMGAKHASWVKPKRIMDIFDGSQKTYNTFLEDYEDYKSELDLIKTIVAG